MREIRLVVLDLAGTTLEDRGQVPEAFRAALLAHGIELDPGEIQGLRGASKREAIRELIARRTAEPTAREAAAAVYASFRSELRQRFRDGGVHAVAGVEQALQWLRTREVRLALNTGFDRDITSLVLDALGWRDRLFDAVVSGDQVPAGRPAPFLIFRAMEATGTGSVHQVASVGDTVLDLQAGWNAGVRVNVGVLTGAHSGEMLREAPHTHLLPSAADLPSLWSA